MSFGFSATRTNAGLDSKLSGADGGAIVFYDGATVPASVDDAVTGVEAARLPLNATAFAAAVESGAVARAAMNTSPAVEDADPTGSANEIKYFRVENSGGTDIGQGTVSADGDGGTIEFSSIASGNPVIIPAGIKVTLTALLIDDPQFGA